MPRASVRGCSVGQAWIEREVERRRRERGETLARGLDGLGSHDIHRGEAEGGEGGDSCQDGDLTASKLSRAVARHVEWGKGSGTRSKM